MKKFVATSSLSLFFGALFLGSLVAQAFAGRAEYNEEQLGDGLAPVGLSDYVLSAHFAVDVTENWQSEYLQFTVFILATVWLFQRGSPESKSQHELGQESEKQQKLGRWAGDDSSAWAKAGGWRTALYSRSLGLVMGLIFLACWSVQAISGWAVYNEERLNRLQDPVGFGSYLLAPDFWSRSLQNWQSEFLAVGSMVVLAIYLRQRGSPESKPVGVSHEATGVEG
ncbi:MAG: DUF6766 family protein [Nocardioides sp.]